MTKIPRVELDGTVTFREKTVEEMAHEVAMDAQEAIDQPIRVIKSKIVGLEAAITPRRLREASADTAAGSAAGRQWLKEQDALIAAERAKL